MGLFNILDPFLDFILRPLLSLDYLLFLLAISFIISLGLILTTKYLTNQKLMKELKDSMKSYQEQIKESKSNPSKAMELQKKFMTLNFEYMKHSFKPTLYSIIPIIILFGWMSANVAYLPIASGDNFDVTVGFDKRYNSNVTIDVPENIEVLSIKAQEVIDGKSSWNLSSKEKGDYELVFKTNDEMVTKRVLITDELRYLPVVKTKKTIIDFIYGSKEGYLDKKSVASSISLGNKHSKPLGDISIFGWKPGWLGVYIISSIIFTMALRKFMKVY